MKTFWSFLLSLSLSAIISLPSFADDGPIERRPRKPGATEPAKPAPAPEPAPAPAPAPKVEEQKDTLPAPPLPADVPKKKQATKKPAKGKKLPEQGTRDGDQDGRQGNQPDEDLPEQGTRYPDEDGQQGNQPPENDRPDRTGDPCYTTGDLSLDCVTALADPRQGLPMFNEQNELMGEFFGEYHIQQIFKSNGSGFSRLRGVNGDGSKSGPMELSVWEVRFYNWSDSGRGFEAAQMRPLGKRSFEVQLGDTTRARRDNMILECSAPATSNGDKLICSWNHENERGEIEFRGYIDLRRN